MASFWVIGIIYAVVLAYLGFYSAGKARDTGEYLVAGRSLGPFVIACTWAATWVSASCFLGSGGLAYRYGWPAMVYQTAMLGGLAFPLVIAGKRLHLFTRALDVYSLADYIGARVDSVFVRSFIALIVIIFYIPVMTAQFKGAGVAVQAILHVPYGSAVVVAGILILFYTAAGGFRAVAYTDTFQAIIMGIAMVIAIPLITWACGGFGAINARLAAENPTLVAFSEPTYFTPVTLLAVFIWAPLVSTASPYVTVRFQVMKDWRILKKVFIYAAIMNVIFLSATYMGLVARAEYGTALKDADLATPTIIADKLPSVISAILLVGILAAMMSSTDSLLLTVGTALSNDIFKKGLLRQMSDKTMLLTSRIVMVICGAASLLLALFKPPAFLTLLLYFGSGGIASSIIGPFVLSLYSKKITKVACEISIPVSMAFYILISFKQFGIGLNVFLAGVLGMAFSMALTYILSLFTKQTISEETMKKVSEVLG